MTALTPAPGTEAVTWVFDDRTVDVFTDDGKLEEGKFAEGETILFIVDAKMRLGFDELDGTDCVGCELVLQTGVTVSFTFGISILSPVFVVLVLEAGTPLLESVDGWLVAVVSGLPPLRPIKYPQPPLMPPFRPIKLFHPPLVFPPFNPNGLPHPDIAVPGKEKGIIGWFGLPPPWGKF